MVVDGTGSPPMRADVGIIGDRIAAVGEIDGAAREEIDAEGRVVAPGFVDGHTHMDAQVFWDPLGSCSCYHGVTTVVMGNCGFTLAPTRPDRHDLVVRSIERAEDIAGTAIAAGIDWQWETFAEYLDAVERQPKGINYAAQIGHSALRAWAMGERAYEEAANDDDLALMAAELSSALDAGAFGFTTSMSSAHATTDDGPVASRLADWNEIDTLVGLLGRRRPGGIFELAVEDAGFHTWMPGHVAVADRLRRLALSTGVTVTYGTTTPDAFGVVDAIVGSGGQSFGQTHSRGVSSIMSFRTTMPFDKLAAWRPVRATPLAEQRRILSDPVERAGLVEAAHHGDYGVAIGVEARAPDYEKMCAFDSALPPHRSIESIASERGVDPVEVIIDLALASDFDQLFIQSVTDDDDRSLLDSMRHPHSVMTFSDAGAHVTQISDCSVQTHLLGYWVREREEFTIEEAVRMVTAVPASRWGIADRGLLLGGKQADVVVFDPETIQPALPTVVTDLPGGAKRLKQLAVGIDAIVVGGRTTHRNGEPTGALPGTLIRA
jgi:N-acyl-D-aspartate/D-glutamate deacylase